MKIFSQKPAIAICLLIGMAIFNDVFATVETETKALTMADSDIAGNLIQTSIGLMVILALIAGAAWLAKRFGNFKIAAQGQMKVVAGLSLGAKERVVLLELGDEQLLLGVAPGRIQTLHILDKPLLSNGTKPSAKSFSDKLGAAMSSAMGRPDTRP